MKKKLSALFLMLLAAANLNAADSTTMQATTSTATLDGRTFDRLAPADVEALSAPDQAAYQAWEAARHTEQSSTDQSSTYQSSEGPNTMDISSDFSM
jgi:hypothetical protein